MFKTIQAKFEAEPVAAVGVLTAGISLGAAFGLQFTAEQVAALSSFAGIVLAFFARSKTYAAAPLDKYLAEAQAVEDNSLIPDAAPGEFA